MILFFQVLPKSVLIKMPALVLIKILLSFIAKEVILFKSGVSDIFSK